MTSPYVASKHQPHNRWTTHRKMPLVLNIGTTLQKSSPLEKALRELLLLPKPPPQQGHLESIPGNASTYFRLSTVLRMKIPDHGGIVKLAMCPDAPPSAPAMVRCSSQPTSANGAVL